MRKTITLKRHPLTVAIQSVLRVWHLQGLVRK